MFIFITVNLVDNLNYCMRFMSVSVHPIISPCQHNVGPSEAINQCKMTLLDRQSFTLKQQVAQEKDKSSTKSQVYILSYFSAFNLDMNIVTNPTVKP